MGFSSVQVVVTLLIIATGVAIFARRMKIPYTVSLVIVGLLLSMLQGTGVVPEHLFQIELSKELILLVFLPPLLFEGTINMDLEILRRQWIPVALLAMLGTLLSTGVLGMALGASFGFSVAGALLLGAMLAPTDPVSVLAIFKEEGVDHDLSSIVEGESVFNDGIGVVLFLIFLQMVVAEHPVGLGHGLMEFAREILIGGGLGLTLGYITHRILGRIDDRFTETTISVALAYGAYLIAEEFHASGVIAVVAAGLIIGNYGKVLSMSPTTRLSLSTFWEVAGFIVNSLLFLLMGLACNLPQLGAQWRYIAVAFTVMIVARAWIVYGIFGLWNRLIRWAGLRHRPVSARWQHVINWGGLRGSIPIALALGLPAGMTLTTFGEDLSKGDITQIVFGVVLLSMLIQGLTFGRLLRNLGFGREPLHVREYELLRGRTISLKSAREKLDGLHGRGEITARIYRGIRHELDQELGTLATSVRSLFDQHYALHDSEYQKVSRALLLAQRASLEDAHRQGLLGEEAMSHLTQDIDAKLASDGSPFYRPDEIDDVPDLVE